MSLPKVDRREQTEDVKGSGVKFSDMAISPELVASLRRCNFVEATEIQEAAIPIMLSGVDVVARAKNGTGKTGAFSIPILARVKPELDYPQAVVLVHTRELAMQVSRNMMQYAELLPLKNRIMCLVGGVSIAEDEARLKDKPIIIIGTPGRVRAMAARYVDLSRVGMFVIDEADKLIGEPDFEPDIRAIRAACHKKAQICLFSATFPRSIEKFCDEMLTNPEMINCMTNALTLVGVTQYLANVRDKNLKVKLINILFQKLQINQCIIFVNNYRECEPLAYMLTQDLKIPTLYVHSKMDLETRSRIFHDFSEGHSRVLVTTDLYTRGIDIRAVNVVINFDVPRNSDDYLHRIGRCGRFGHKGLAISLVTGEMEKNRFLQVDQQLRLIANGQIKMLPVDLSQIPASIYAFSANDLIMK